VKDDEPDLGLDAVIAAIERFAAAYQARMGSWSAAGADWERLSAAVQAAFGGIPALVGMMALVGAFTALACIGASRFIRRFVRAGGFAASCGVAAASFVAGVAVGLILARLASRGFVGQVHASLAGAAVTAALACLVWAVHGALIHAVRDRDPDGASPPVRRMALLLNIALAWGLAGAAVMHALSAWRPGMNGLRDLVGTLGFGGPVVIAIGAIVLAHRRKVAALIGGPRPRSAFRGMVARHWPVFLPAAMLLVYLSGQIALTAGAPLPSLTLITASLALLSLPYLDRVLRLWSRRATGVDALPAGRVALRRTARPAAVAVILGLLLSVWLSPVFAFSGAGTGRIAWLAVEIALIGLVSAFAWNLVSVVADRANGQGDDAKHGEGDGEGETPRTRFETLAPLLGATAKTIIASLGVLSILVALGVSVWPIVTGLSVFGIAIGFGSQTLVKDIVSGVFFLADDAFRMGEYIETTGAKGTVEKISLRSVSLRHHRGPLATIPYGSIGRVLNFSRDYAIEKVTFRVAIDTDVEMVRKLFKKIGQELAEDPELKDDLLQPFKSQGIENVEDGTLLVRGKFMAKAGRQHNIRKKVMLAVHKAFLENGIQAVARPISAAVAR
jgi:moderate conductance mechanosensitive channel